jgi:uncharacterized protein YndB with AHSA1/START domain
VTDRSTAHATFTIERTLAHSPARVYAAFADQEAKARWFRGPDEDEAGRVHTLDFRVGGREHLAGPLPGGSSVTFDATYLDLVPEERIIYSYDMRIDGQRISVSLAAIEFRVAPGGTHLTVTEHGIYLDGLDDVAQRERGTHELLDNLTRTLDAVTETAR